jgi:hypothetical protein
MNIVKQKIAFSISSPACLGGILYFTRVSGPIQISRHVESGTDPGPLDACAKRQTNDAIQ